MSKTYAILPVSKECYEEIMHALHDVGYDHLFKDDNGRVVIHMDGLALARATLTE